MEVKEARIRHEKENVQIAYKTKNGEQKSDVKFRWYIKRLQN